MIVGNKNSTSIIEYTILLAVFIAAVIAMQIYLKRAMQGKLKLSTDSIGEQFSPTLSNYTYVRGSSSMTHSKVWPEGVSASQLLEPQINIVTPYKDNFSDKKLTEEKLFE